MNTTHRMKTLLKTFLLSTCSLFALAAALPAKVIGSGNVISETREVSAFHALELLASGTAIVTQGDTEGLTIEGEDNITPLVEAKVTDKGTLQIGFKEHQDLHLTKPLVFKISAKALDAVTITGSGDMRAKTLTNEHFAVAVRGSGDVKVDRLETGDLAVTIDGSGNVKLSGKAASQTVGVNGSGDYEAGDLKTGTAAVNVTGSGDCDLAVSDTLTATVSGSGDVSYSGKPTLTKKVSGSGSVEALRAAK